jgi:predicted nucleotidyltransferase
MPLRTYIRYENEDKYIGSLKYEKLLDILEEKFQITEEKGIQKIETIIEVVNDIFKEYDIDFCYLFGSYAKGKQTEISDIDLCISGNVTGLAIFGLVEKLRVGLKKKIDLLRLSEIHNNEELLKEIMRDGIKIYG